MASPAPSPSASTAAPPAECDAQSCSLCMEPFATAAAASSSISNDRRPRVLGCGHSFCGSCLHEDMKRRKCCALCTAAIAHPTAASVPVNFDLIGAIKAAEGAAARMAALRLQMEARVQSPVAVCAECDQPAAHFCGECGDDLCADHSKQVHALKKFQSHTVVAVAEKAALLAARAKRDAQALAKAKENKCALHPTEVKYFYCTDCDETICTACVHGRHAAHKRIEIAEAAAQTRRVFEDELAKVAGSGAKNGGGAGGVNGIGTLADVEKLGRQLRKMKKDVLSSSAVARRGVESLGAEMKAAVDRRCALLIQQLQQDEAAAISAIDPLLEASDQIAAAGAQLCDKVAAAAASDNYGTLDAAPRVGQLFADMEAELRALAQQAAAASGPAGCVSGLRLEDGSKAAALSELAKLGTVAQPRTKIACGQSAKVKPAAGPASASSAPTPVAVRPLSSPSSSSSAAPAPVAVRLLQRLDSRVLPAASEAALLHFFGGTPVPSKLLYRATRDGFERADWDARCLSKGPTMTLVKAKVSGFVFGAYTHCKWPTDRYSDRVADPSGQSFLFSLVSAAGKAARFSLRKKDEAVMLHSNGGVHFGWRASFALFSQGDAAGDIRGNQACVLDARSSYQPDDKDIKGDETFFAGSERFAAADIEVYQL